MKYCNFSQINQRFEIVPWSLDNIDNYEDLIHKVVNLKKRPTIPETKDDNISKYLITIIKECWRDEILRRPTINEILVSMKSKHEYINDLKNFNPIFFKDNSLNNEEKIWSLEEGIDDKMVINNLVESLDEGETYYNLIELKDQEMDPLIKE
jgi:hypothetical protein